MQYYQLRKTVALILIHGIFIPYLLTPHNGPTIIIVIETEEEDDDDEYIELEEGESLSPPSDWEC